jgi:hypothetical protein
MPAVTGSILAPPPALLSTHTCPRCGLEFTSAFDCAMHYLGCEGTTCTALEVHLSAGGDDARGRIVIRSLWPQWCYPWRYCHMPRMAMQALPEANDMLCPSEAGIYWGTAFDCIRTIAANAPSCDLPPRAARWAEQGGAA